MTRQRVARRHIKVLTKKQFNELVRRIKSLGYDEAAVSDYARRIGDTPGHDAAGHTNVREGETVLARLSLDWS